VLAVASMDDIDHLDGNERVRALSLSLRVAKENLNRASVFSIIFDREVGESSLYGRIFGKKEPRIRHS
jgi:hypothetical protein